jgi:hypothetical protein
MDHTLMMHPRWGGFSVPIAIVVCRRQGGSHLYFRAPMPPLCHSRPDSPAVRFASDFGHGLAFSGASAKKIGRVHEPSDGGARGRKQLGR